MSEIPLNDRPDLEVVTDGPISRSLSALGKKHHLEGCVLITFGGDQVGTASWAAHDSMLPAMTELADRVLVMLADGDLDPSAAVLPKWWP